MNTLLGNSQYINIYKDHWVLKTLALTDYSSRSARQRIPRQCKISLASRMKPMRLGCAGHWMCLKMDGISMEKSSKWPLRNWNNEKNMNEKWWNMIILVSAILCSNPSTGSWPLAVVGGDRGRLSESKMLDFVGAHSIHSLGLIIMFSAKRQPDERWIQAIYSIYSHITYHIFYKLLPCS